MRFALSESFRNGLPNAYDEIVSLEPRTFEADLRLAAIVENSDDAIIGENLDHIFVEEDAEVERFTGLSFSSYIFFH